MPRLLGPGHAGRGPLRSRGEGVAGEAGTAYDQLLATGNATGEALVMGAIDALVAQTRSIERAVSALSLEAIAFEGSDSLDNPEAVFQ